MDAPLVRVPCTDDELVANVRHALTLGLPELRDFEYPIVSPLNMVANGPSARTAPRMANTLAINGAIRMWGSFGPTYWAGGDPQELLADLIGEPQRNTIFLVASKCHPAVFDKLKSRNVILWHVADDATWNLLAARMPVAAWASVTISVFELMARMGWRKFDVWGWDCCVLNDAAHACPQHLRADLIQVEVAGRRFTTTHAWVHEANCAAQALAGFPFPVTVHGPGLAPALFGSVLPRRVMTDHQS